jgi:predicted NAD/FAD-binding protein
VAIVGAGISGLTVAHLLAPDHELTIYEAAAHAGGHTNTITVSEPGHGQGERERILQIDTGFIVFNDRNYPTFERLLGRLGVPWQPSDMSFSVSDEHGGLEYAGHSLNALYARRSHLLTPWFQRMVLDLVRFNRRARELLHSDSEESLRSWLERHGFSRAFVEKLIVPQAAAVWSADPEQLWSFPAAFLARFFENHGMLGLVDRPRWRTVQGGSRRYVEALLAPLGRSLRLASPVETVERHEDHVLVRARGDSAAERYDHVVLATHSDQALKLLADPSERERELLSAIPYQRNEAVLHTDRSLLPRRRRAWASWNYHLLDQPRRLPTVTYHMNRLQSLEASEQYCVTLNRTDAIDPRRIIRVIDYAHPVFTPAGLDAQRRIHEISAQRRTHYCGAYWRWGFHEDGALSGLRVAQRLGARTW